MEAIFLTVAMHLQLYTLISYIFLVQTIHKRWFKVYTSLQQGTRVLYCGPILQVNGSVCAKSGGLWSHLAGSRSTPWLFCTKSSMHGISAIKTRWSLTTEIVNSSFYCMHFLLFICVFFIYGFLNTQYSNIIHHGKYIHFFLFRTLS